jgi:uncharacterized membrane protein YdjX (TVP38/TMEM64 family)
LFLVPFLVWGEFFEDFLAPDKSVAWLESFGAWAWIIAMLFLMADLILPVPATVIMAALGICYGPGWGGLIGGLGSVLSGLIAYGICMKLGRGAARFLAGEKDLARAEGFFNRYGGWAVVLSRWMPILPEVVACMAGLTRMPFWSFLSALVCGSLPMAWVYAFLGHAGSHRPWLALGLSALAPPVLWVLVRLLFTEGNKK